MLIIILLILRLYSVRRVDNEVSAIFERLLW